MSTLREDLLAKKMSLRDELKDVYRKLSLLTSMQSNKFTDEYLRLTYKGRDEAGSQELQSGYMGCGTFDSHIRQMNDPGSWVHSSADCWYKLAQEMELSE